jgi:hypothetical protein
MKLWRTGLLITSAAFLMIMISCHTETPLNIDNQNPEAELVLIYNDTDTLYNSADTSAVFTDFQQSILEGTHYIKIRLADNGDLYKLVLNAEDNETAVSYPISSLNEPSEGEIILSFNYKDFPVVQEQNPQEFFISATVNDESENKVNTAKLGFKVVKVFPFNLFFDELGLIKEIQGDSVDFREKNNKLAFIQFMYDGCLSCVEEAQAMKAVYADTNYDHEKYSHSLFGRKFVDEADFLSFKTRDYKLPFDCFFDNSDVVRSYFSSLVNKPIDTAVFAVLPNGKIVEYNYLEGDFTTWIHSMYSLAYPNK